MRQYNRQASMVNHGEEEQRRTSNWYTIMVCISLCFTLFISGVIYIAIKLDVGNAHRLFGGWIVFWISFALVIGIFVCRRINLATGHQGDGNEHPETDVVFRSPMPRQEFV